MFALNRAAAIGAVCLGLLGATSAQADILTWDFGTNGSTISTPPGIQPIGFTEYDYLGDGHTLSVSAGLFDPSFFLGTDLIQTINGLGAGPIDPSQVGPTEFIRIGLDNTFNEVTSVTFRNATPFFDDYLILGSNNPNTDFFSATVIDGTIFGFGLNHTQTGPAEFQVSLSGASGFDYLFFLPLALGPSDGFSILSIDGDVAVPEPASLAIFGMGLAGLGFVRRRRRNA